MDTIAEISVEVNNHQAIVAQLRKGFDRAQAETEAADVALAHVNENLASGRASEADARAVRDRAANATARREEPSRFFGRLRRTWPSCETRRVAREAEAETVRAAELAQRKERGRAIGERMLVAIEASCSLASIRDSRDRIRRAFGDHDANDVSDLSAAIPIRRRPLQWGG